MAGVVVASPATSEQTRLPGAPCRELAHHMAPRSKKASCLMEHRGRVDHVLDHVVHRHDVVPPLVACQAHGLEHSIDDDVATRPAACGHLGLDLDACALDVAVAPELVEMTAVPSPDVEQPTRTTSEQPAIVAAAEAGPHRH